MLKGNTIIHLGGEGGQPRFGGVAAAEQPQLGAVVVGEVGASEARRRHGGHHVPRLLRQRRRVRVEEEVVRRQELGEVHAVAGHHLHGHTVSVGSATVSRIIERSRSNSRTGSPVDPR